LFLTVRVDVTSSGKQMTQCRDSAVRKEVRNVVVAVLLLSIKLFYAVYGRDIFVIDRCSNI